MASRFIRWRWIWAVFGITAILLAGVIVFTAAVPISSNTLRRRLVSSLSTSLESDVQLSDIHLHLFPRLRVDGSGLLVRRHGGAERPPLIAVKGFSVDGDLVGLLRKHVAHVTLEGLEIQIPPASAAGKDRAEAPGPPARSAASGVPSTRSVRDGVRVGWQAPAPPDHASASSYDPHKLAKGVVIDSLDTDDAKLVIIPADTAKRPSVWAIHHLHMTNVGLDEPMPFRATLTNGVPPGEIETVGRFGPWHRDDPGFTPLDGTFTFAEADLSVFKGIRGMLSAQGDFRGTLNRIDVTGETDTPDFVIDVSGHPFPLHAKYHTIVDGTNGNTRLERIDARFLRSSLIASGSVMGAAHDQRGRTVSLDIALTRARLEDVLVMAVKAPKPPMLGVLKMTTKFLLPPGETDVVERLLLDGQFAIDRVRFTNLDVQGRIEELSRRTRGPRNVVDKEKESVASTFKGRFKLGNGRLVLSDLGFEVPGAKIRLTGQYALRAETLDFRGVMLMDAKLSQTQTGVKALLLKAVDPFFRKNGTSQLPIKIGGTRSDPSFGLDMRRVFKRGN